MIFEKTPEWFTDAACIGLDPNIFFPSKHDAAGRKKALEICAGCSVVDDCRDYALELAQVFDTQGIFGGTSYKQRAIMLRKQNLSTRRLGVAW